MKGWRKSVAGMFVFGAGALASVFGVELVRNVQFAHAQQQVEASREQLQKVEDLASVFREVGKAVEPSVVNIRVTKTTSAMGGLGGGGGLPFDPEMLRRFFPDRDGDGEPDVPEGFQEGFEGQLPPQQGTGSGVIIEVKDKAAFILTNNHVAGDASEMQITLNDGRVIENAKLVGADPKTDLAVLRIEADRLIPAKWGDSDQLQKGDWILAFGSPFGYVGSMTHGIVSALGRKNIGILGPMGYENFIQVDAPINPGNSGGPLVNVRGEVVGINTAIASLTGGSMGIGFSIPSNQVKEVYAELRDKGKVTRGYLGVGIDDVKNPRDPQTKAALESLGFQGSDGVVVISVQSDSPAAGKLRAGDVVTAAGGKKVASVTELRNLVAMTDPGQELKLTVFRDGKEQEVAVNVAEQPDTVAMAGGRRGPGQRRPGGSSTTAETLGLRLSDLTAELAEKHGLGDLSEQGGALVTAVAPNSPAAREGLQVGDLITRVGKERVRNAQEATAALGKADLSKGVTLYVTNRDESKLITLSNGNRTR